MYTSLIRHCFLIFSDCDVYFQLHAQRIYLLSFYQHPVPNLKAIFYNSYLFATFVEAS